MTDSKFKKVAYNFLNNGCGVPLQNTNAKVHLILKTLQPCSAVDFLLQNESYLRIFFIDANIYCFLRRQLRLYLLTKAEKLYQKQYQSNMLLPFVEMLDNTITDIHIINPYI